MTEQENKYKKVPVKTFNLGDKGYLTICPTIKGYHLWGEIGEKHVDVQGKNLSEVYQEVTNQLDNANRDYLKNAITCEEVSLRIKENIKINENPLEKLAKDLKGKITKRKEDGTIEEIKYGELKWNTGKNQT